MQSDATIRPLTVKDCTQRYVDWLNDPEVSRFLETRWQAQTLETITAFVKANTLPDRHLFAICIGDLHIGNIKLGPINSNHSYADVSYFIGDRAHWGKGHATQAVKLVSEFGFKNLRLHRLQAGVYARNQASQKVLRKAGFSNEGVWYRQLKTENGWDDHIWYARMAGGSAL